ncbi:MAG: deoxyhypusine synthase [Deltaproteobacteria bacterium]|nr:MAG: deoxyhypusine synthase [Deltaproteobacteria bacterium]RLF53310.1 MAG: deoxyhypusine synthase [Thermoplasmata archaeon]
MKQEIVKDIQLRKGMKIDEIVKQLYDSGGFTAKKLAQGVDIIEKMIEDKNCVKFLSFPACICSTGTRGVIKELLKKKLFDVVITTCGTLDHDLARVWENYYHGSFMVDDKELYKKGINRLGNIFIPNKSYGIVLEKKIQPILAELYKIKQKWSTKELVWKFGKQLEKEKNKEESIVYWAYKNKIPMFIPGITDGAFGSQIWMYYQEHRDFTIDLLKDEQELSDIIFNSKKTGALIIGGGISKHHTIWWAQYRDGLDYTVYVTTAVEYDGSLSGAQTREAISWGKIKEEADNVTVQGDATVLLPLMISALFERI